MWSLYWGGLLIDGVLP